MSTIFLATATTASPTNIAVFAPSRIMKKSEATAIRPEATKRPLVLPPDIASHQQAMSIIINTI